MRVVRGAIGPLIVAVATLLYTSGPLARMRTWFVSLADDGVVADDVPIQAIYGLLGLAGLVVLVTGGRWRRVPLPLFVAGGALTLWYLLSATWSGDAETTVRNSIFIGTTLIAGAGAAVALPLRALAWSVWSGVHVGLLWSFVALRRNVNSIDFNGKFAGVYFNRNSLALYAALGVLLGLAVLADLVVEELRRRRAGGASAALEPIAVVGGVAALLLLPIDWWMIDGTDAATPTVALMVAVVVAVVAAAARRLVRRGASTDRVVATGGASLIALGVIAWFSRASLLERLGRRSDLTGRTGLWDVAIEWANRRPLQGYGYLGAWSNRRFVREVRQASKHRLFSAHNGFIEAYLGGGTIGLLVFTALIVLVFYLVATAAVSDRSTIALWPLAVFIFAFVENLTESLIVSNQLVVALLTGTAVAAVGIRARSDESAGVSRLRR